jgi:putative transposase
MKSSGRAAAARYASEMTAAMATGRPQRNVDDPRVRELIRSTDNPDLFPELDVPRSTAAGWLRGEFKTALGIDLVSTAQAELHGENAKLKRRVLVLATVMRLLLVLVRVSGCRLTGDRLPEGKAKAEVLAAIAAAKKALSLKSVLRIMGLSPARFHAWRRLETACQLADRPSCPKTHPGQLTAQETGTIKEMVTSVEYRHMATSTLAVYAQRVGRVLASASTWTRLVRAHGWRRPRARVYPAKPKVGIRAKQPNEIWHLDVTVLCLLDGTRLYLHGVVDNFSRRVLAWRLAEKLDPSTTCQVLAEAAKNLQGGGSPVSVLTDSGVENVNDTVDEFLSGGLLRRVLAQVEILESNSLVEVWWRGLRHQGLYLNTLDTAAAVRRLVAFYVKEFNQAMPHSALNGRTLDEVYFGKGDDIPVKLAAERQVARASRLAENRALACETCMATSAAPGVLENAA